ncbi:MAG TPA: aldo/keto reductase [Candidatus Galloscillospira stercoripullorum]|nr:aldo/keto reductase [Candidatus Galloscillospira stercoripullorum]
MIYKPFQNCKLSALGMGTMRLPVVDGNDAQIDEAAAFALIDRALEQGIDYFDTAWGYHSGNSELVVGKALARHPRESFYLASKFPGYDLKNMGKAEEIFTRQLEKCQVEYFDFYLIHNVCEMNIDAYLDTKYGDFAYLLEQKKAGRIRHFGFSAHGSLEVMERFLQAYGKEMEFCQIQLNWLDWTFQNAREKVELLKKYGLPVWVMEPVRGGKLATLEEKYEKRLKALRPEESTAAWAFRFVQSLPEVVVTLSGMSNMEQLEENLRTFAQEKPLSAGEREQLAFIAADMTGKTTVPCTACRYCTSHCPQGLDIPGLLELYNEHRFTGGGFLAPMALSAIPKDKWPSACVGCRSCEAVCPQQIRISEALADFTALLQK